jgi:3-oxoacyl-[acyl-carrier protein] reductase
MDLQLKGKRALVTGSSSGIGEGIAKSLAAEGVSVVLQGRRRAELERVAKEIVEAGGKSAIAVGDLGTDAAADAVAESALKAFGGLDILINNAGAFPMINWLDGPADAWNDLYNQNVGSMVRMINRIVPSMKTLGWGRIINIASCVGLEPTSEMPAYTATKAANLNMTVSLSKKLAGTGITVNSVSPGPIVTAGMKDLFTGVAKQMGWGSEWPEIVPHVLELMPSPTGRLGEVADVADMVAFLVSPRTGFVTGSNVRVDGGQVHSL